MWLICKLTPDFKTIADFRKDNILCMKSVFMEFNTYCMEQGLFGGKTIGIDGTKIKAWNSRERNHNRKVIEKRIRDAEDKVDGYLKELDRNDEVEKDEQEIKNMKEKIEALKKKGGR